MSRLRLRVASLKITPHEVLSRIVTDIRKETLIINLPGSPKGAAENLQVVLPVLEHAINLHICLNFCVVSISRKAKRPYC